MNNAIVYLYHKNTSDSVPPTLFSGSFTYTFATALLSGGVLNGWSQTAPAIVAGEYLWLAQAVASSSIVTDAIATAEFSAPAVVGVGGTDGATGATGAAGYNTATLTAYQRAPTAPTVMPTNGLTYTFATAAWTPGGLWSKTIPAYSTDPLWAVSATAYSDTATDTIATADWSSAVQLNEDGADGAAGTDGLNVATVYIYQRTATDVAPSLPTTPSATFTFATGALDALNNGWTKTVPPAGTDDFLWVSFATASNIGATDEILAAEWQAAQKLAETGATGDTGDAGADGLNTATVSLYHKNTSNVTPPAAFSGTFTYTFSTAALTGGTLNGWSQTAPDIGQGEYLWVRQAAAVNANATDSIVSTEFAGAVVVGIGGTDGATGGTGPQGDAGIDGLNNATAYLYHKNTSSVTPPTAFSGTFTYTFATALLSGGTLNGWTQTAPAIGPGEYLWLRQATASSITTTDSILATEFSAATVISIGGLPGDDGNAGANGSSVHVSSVYKRSVDNPGTPTGGQFVFGTNVLTPPSGWSITPPADNGTTLWVSTAVWSIIGPTGTDSATTWTAPQQLINPASGQVLSTRDWRDSAVAMDGGQVWDQTGSTPDNSTLVFNEAGPFGDYPPIMQIRGDGLTNPGWYSQWVGKFAYDNEKSYVIYQWVKRRGGAAAGLYVGFPTAGAGSEHVASMTGVPNTNPYTVPNQSFTAEKWFLQVSVVWGLNSGLTVDQGLAGIYDPDTGLKIYDGAEFKWDSNQFDTTYIRTGFYDNVAPPIPATDGFDFTRVTGWVMDGGEPTIQQVLSGGIGLPKGSIVGGVKINYSTFDTPNPGEMYIHGLDALGRPADVDGSFVYNGSRLPLLKGYVFTNVETNNGYIVIETGVGTPFTTASAGAKMAGCQVVVTAGVAQWQYDNNTAWVNFTATDTMVIIGTYASGVDNVLNATLIPPMPLYTGVVSAARINANSLRAITATIGNLNTRDIGGAPTTPRLALSDSNSPLTIFDTDDTTVLFNLTNTEDGLRLGLLGDFEPNSLNTAQAFSTVGINSLRGRLGLLQPTGGTTQRGGDLQKTAANQNASNGSTHLCNLDENYLASTIKSKPDDITLTFKIVGNDWDSGFPGYARGDWTMQWQVSANGGAYTNIAGASFNVLGNISIESEPGGPVFYSYYLSEQRTYVWTGSVADVEYTFRLVCTLNSGTDIGYIQTLTASEPLNFAGVLEVHDHDASQITTGLLAGARINQAELGVDASTISTLVRRNSSGDINVRLLRSEYDSTNPTIGYIMTQIDTASNNYVRPSTPAQLTAGLPLATTGVKGLMPALNGSTSVFLRGDGAWAAQSAPANYLRHITTGYNDGEITVSGTAPGAPTQGDVWIDTAATLDASTLGGLSVNTTTVNNVANQIMRTNSSGYGMFGWINTISGVASAAEPARIYCSQDAYIRYMTAANFRTYVTASYYAPISHTHSYLPVASPTFTGTLTGPSAEMTDLGLNSNPGEGDLRVGGYGIMGSRAGSVVYVTNASTTGSVAINTGGVHGSAYNRGVFSNTGLVVTGVMTATGQVQGSILNASSDVTLKTLKGEYAPTRMSEVRAWNYDFKDGPKNKIGYIAQDIQAILPGAVGKDPKGKLTLDYNMVLVAKVADIEARMEAAGL